MALNRGLIGTRSSTADKPIKNASVFPVALVLTMPTEPDLYYFDSPADALAYFRETIHTSGGNWEKYLEVWEDNFPTTVQVLISSAQIVEDDADAQKANVINAINDMKRFGSKFDVRPDIVAVADFPKDRDIVTQMVVVNGFFQSRSWYDIESADASEAKLFRKDIASERISLITTPFIKFNPDTKTNEQYDGGVIMAMQRAYIDSLKPYNWFASVSNLPINMTDAKYVADYHVGADETDPYSDSEIWCVIKDGGLRPWGSDYTCSTDPIWQNGSRVRLVDLAIRDIRRALRDNIDKDLSELSVLKSSLSAYSRKLIGQGLLLDGEILLDEEKTTPAEITAGNFYFIFNFQDMPKARRVVVNMNYTDAYSPIAYKLLEAI